MNQNTGTLNQIDSDTEDELICFLQIQRSVFVVENTLAYIRLCTKSFSLLSLL